MDFFKAQYAVDKGAFLLDVIRPGWAYKIDLEVFDLRSASSCIIGQLFTYYHFEQAIGVDGIYNNGFAVKEDGTYWSVKGREVNTESDCECCGPTYDMWDVMHEMWAHKIRKAQV